MNSTLTVEVVESLVDQHGMAEMLEMIQEVAYQKQAHVEEAWQDVSLGRKWKAVAETINRAIAAAKQLP